MDEVTAEAEEILHEKQLPYDLVAHHILTRLPIKPLLQFKCVSKQWYSTLSSSHFTRLYTRLSLFSYPSSPIQYLFIQNGNKYYLLSHDDDNDIGTSTSDVNKNLYELRLNFHVVLNEKLVLVGSCNGLVCLASSSGYFFILWNPVTGKFRKYSDLELSIDSSIPFRVSWGFGYVFNVDDFKVVRVLELPATLQIRVHVFSLKSNKWMRIADELHQDIFSLRSPTVGKFQFYCEHTNAVLWFPFTFFSMRGVLVDETLYWIVSKTESVSRKIVAFDLVSELFDDNVNLDLVSTSVYGDNFICNMGGCLSKCGSNMRDDVYIDILKDSGKVESIHLFRNLQLCYCRDLVGFTRTGKFFIQRDGSELGLLDPNSKPMKYSSLVKSKRLTVNIASFVPGLTLPYTTGESSG